MSEHHKRELLVLVGREVFDPVLNAKPTGLSAYDKASLEVCRQDES